MPTEEETNAYVIEYVQREMRSRGWGSVRLSQELSVCGYSIDRDTIGKMLKGERRVRSHHVLGLAEVFGVELDVLMRPPQETRKIEAEALAVRAQEAIDSIKFYASRLVQCTTEVEGRARTDNSFSDSFFGYLSGRYTSDRIKQATRGRTARFDLEGHTAPLSDETAKDVSHAIGSALAQGFARAEVQRDEDQVEADRQMMKAAQKAVNEGDYDKANAILHREV